ncbi:MAG: glycoside hydrolase family 20 zincin-like fold domain-containing protein [Ilyomonas sp.]
MIKNFVLLVVGIFSYCTTSAQSRLPVSLEENNEKINLSISCLLPVPQNISFSSETFYLDTSWTLEDVVVTENNQAIETLLEGLKEKGIALKNSSAKAFPTSAHVIHFTIKDGAVAIGPATDTNRTELQKQAYHLILSDTGININANTSQGLFYGVQTLLQLINSQKDSISLPAGEITDWPDLNVRIIYWDDAHHLEKMEVLKRAIRQAANYKINAFAIKLEGHFQFQSAPAIVEPYALSANEYKELSDYAKQYFVEVVPYLDAPAHVSFILKHPEYAHLRAFPNSNYEFSIINPQTDSLLLKMFDELIKANKGGKYVLLSTDEAYYAGKSASEEKQAEKLGGRGKLLARFISRIANELHKQGRKVIFWGEYPLEPGDIPALPSHLINGEYDSSTASLYKAAGIRQFIYTYTQGEEPLFPSYYPMSSGDTVADANKDRRTGRVEGMLRTISSATAEHKGDLAGVFIAGWADAGLHPETFWLGYATGAAAGWNHREVTSNELTDHFYHSFYGLGTVAIDSVYKLLSRQAQFYDESWIWAPSQLRSPIFGNSVEVYKTPKPAKDQVLPLLPVPSAEDLSIDSNWNKTNHQRLQLATAFLKENDDLIFLLNQNLRSVTYNRYSLEVMLSVALLCRQNLKMLLHLQHIDKLLQLASHVASKDASAGVALIDEALNEAEIIKTERDQTLESLITVWYKTWFPHVEKANGRRYLNVVDDVKDHRPGRTADMSYLIYRDLHYPLGKWFKAVQTVRNSFAEKNGLVFRKEELNWEQVY